MPPGRRDIELVARANRGDTAAFEQIYHCHRDFVFRLALRRLGNTDDALDVLQDTFMKLFARFPGFELSAAMTSFLYPVVDHLCRDRRALRRHTVDIDDVGGSAERLSVVPASSGDAASLLSRLRPEQRELLTLRFVDDLSLPQLAEMLGAPVGTIKSRLHRAITALRQKVDAPGRKP
jgi:RNA polymerase sigma-70 factor (ECF subfamily)